jgi:hypothetical protein
MFIVGLPSYYVFFIQGYMTYELFSFLLTTDATDSYCSGDTPMLWVITAVFLIYMTPAFKTIVLETTIVLLCKRTAFEHDIDSDVVKVHKLQAPFSKRLFIWLMLVLPEFLVLLCVFITGIGYMYVDILYTSIP